MSSKLKFPTKLEPAQLGQGGHLKSTMAKMTAIQQMKVQRQHLDHQIKLAELGKSASKPTPKASAPKNQGRVK